MPELAGASEISHGPFSSGTKFDFLSICYISSWQIWWKYSKNITCVTKVSLFYNCNYHSLFQDHCQYRLRCHWRDRPFRFQNRWIRGCKHNHKIQMYFYKRHFCCSHAFWGHIHQRHLNEIGYNSLKYKHRKKCLNYSPKICLNLVHRMLSVFKIVL